MTVKQINSKPKTLEEAKDALHQAEKVLEKTLEARIKENSKRTVDLAKLGHELMNPLNVITGYSEMLADKQTEFNAEAFRKQAMLINKAAVQAFKVCDRLLAAYSEEGEARKVEHKKVNLKKILSGVTKMFGKMARERGVELKLDIADDFPVVKTDPVRLQQVLANVITNAIKFTPKKGRVQVKGEVRNDEALIIVITDDGRGISPESLKWVMEAGYKVPGSAPDGEIKGFGLGLNIANRLMGELGGKLDIQSRLGVGTTVSLIFPKESVT